MVWLRVWIMCKYLQKTCCLLYKIVHIVLLPMKSQFSNRTLINLITECIFMLFSTMYRVGHNDAPPLHNRIGKWDFFQLNSFRIRISLQFHWWRPFEEKKIKKRYGVKCELTSMKCGSISAILQCIWCVCFTELGAVISTHLFWKFFFLKTVFTSEIATKFCYKMSLAEKIPFSVLSVEVVLYSYYTLYISVFPL